MREKRRIFGDGQFYYRPVEAPERGQHGQQETANGRISAILDGKAWFTGLERPSLRMELQEIFTTQFFLLSARLLNP